jgi:3-phenylpropionate/cinnamic acid dioxygenase small subunit
MSHHSAPHDGTPVAAVDDLHAIEALQRLFGRLNDEARWPELAALFTEDAHFTRPSAPHRPVVGRAAILQAFVARPAGPPRRHLVANPLVQLRDASTAHASCYSIVVSTQDAQHGSIAVGGFHDQLVRTEQGWRFQARTGFTLIDPIAFSALVPLSELMSRLTSPALPAVPSPPST